MYTLDITLPVLDEEASLEAQVLKVLEFLRSDLSVRSDVGEIKVSIVDNGSVDGTERIGVRLEREHDEVRYIRLSERGVGRALKAAWSTSDSDIVGYMDLDLATDISHLNQVLDVFERNEGDIVSGSRLKRGSVVVGRTLKREVTSRVFNIILQIYLRANFSDGMCGFKFLKRDLVPSLIRSGADSNGWFFATELLVVSQWRKLRIVEIPVRWTDDPNSKVNVNRLAKEYLLAMNRLKAKK